jgi:hypothetical protein
MIGCLVNLARDSDMCTLLCFLCPTVRDYISLWECKVHCSDLCITVQCLGTKHTRTDRLHRVQTPLDIWGNRAACKHRLGWLWEYRRPKKELCTQTQTRTLVYIWGYELSVERETMCGWIYICTCRGYCVVVYSIPQRFENRWNFTL